MKPKKMAKCPKCGKRKAKRACPALEISICSLCCGRLREREIDCPAVCPFLEKHKIYQEKREHEHMASSAASALFPQEDILHDERMAWLAFHIEAPLKTAAEKSPSFADRDALAALEYARSKIEKRKTIFLLDERESWPSNIIGERIIQSMDQCRYEKKIILPDDHLAYSDDEKIKCLERIKLSVLHFAREKPGGRRYLGTILERFAKIKDLSRSPVAVPPK